MSHLRELGVQNWLVSLHAQGPECLVHSAAISDVKDDGKDQVTTATTIVYLSPDAVEPLLDIDPQCVYVIGGIVDRSVRGGQTLKRAQEHASSAVNGHNDVNGNADVKLEPRTTYNVLCRRLPIQEFIPERANHVLNVDCCVHTLCVYMELKDWAKTLRITLPKRKLVRGGKKERYRQNREQALQSSSAANGDGDGDGKEEYCDGEGDSDGDGDGDQSIAALAKNSRWQRWVTREIGLHRWSNSEQ
jgi:tRNA (guanine9-N1)-methyltransferase